MMDINDLRFTYNKKPVLDGVTFNIKQGEILGILGMNGCGKTTLLKNLNKNLEPEAGTILLEDEDMEKMTKRAIAQKVAVVPQGNEIKFAFTVEDIVSMGRIPFLSTFSGESSEDVRLIDEAIEMAGLQDYRKRYINTMSGGERQRVIIARALAQTPEIILMDEPTLHLDINMQFEVLDLIYKLSREKGLTVVIVSHDLPLVARYCDRIIMLKDKKIFASGVPEDILTSENIREVFRVDGELSVDSKTGKRTVNLHGCIAER